MQPVSGEAAAKKTDGGHILLRPQQPVETGRLSSEEKRPLELPIQEDRQLGQEPEAALRAAEAVPRGLPRTYSWPRNPQSVVRSRSQVGILCTLGPGTCSHLSFLTSWSLCWGKMTGLHRHLQRTTTCKFAVCMQR